MGQNIRDLYRFDGEYKCYSSSISPSGSASELISLVRLRLCGDIQSMRALLEATTKQKIKKSKKIRFLTNK